MRTLLLAALGLPLATACLAQGQTLELRTTAADRTGLSITIYQNDLAAVRDTRRVTLPAGMSKLVFADVAATIRAKSAYLLDPGEGLRVMERNFEFNLLSPSNLQTEGLGQPAASRDPASGQWRWGVQASIPWERGLMNPSAPPIARMARMPSAYLVAPTHSILIQREDGFEQTAAPDLAYRALPPSLHPSPALAQTLETARPGPRDLCLLYTAMGLSWEPHYIATLASDGRHLDLAAFAGVDNKSGIDYPDVTFQLVAGIPNVVWDPDPRNALEPSTADATSTVEVVGSSIAPPTFREEKLSEYPLFTLDRPITLLNGQKKQLALFHANRIPVAIQAVVAPRNDMFESWQSYLASCEDPSEPPVSTASPMPLSLDLDTTPLWQPHPFDDAAFNRIYDHESWLGNYRPGVQLQGTILNTRANALGRALPAGNLDLRYSAPEGASIPMGEMYVDQTPSGDSMRIDLGPARGLSAERKVLSLRRVGEGKSWFWELEVAVTLTNRSGRPMETIFREPIFATWHLEQSNLKGRRSGENAYDFRYISKPGSRFTLKYLVKAPAEDQPDPS